MEYWTLMSPGMVGAMVGTLGNSVYKEHPAPLIMKRALENVILGWPVYYLLSRYALPDSAGYYGVSAAVALSIFLLWNNATTRPLVDQLDQVVTGFTGYFALNVGA